MPKYLNRSAPEGRGLRPWPGEARAHGASRQREAEAEALRQVFIDSRHHDDRRTAAAD